VLAPGDSGSLPLITGWFRAIDSLFPGPFVHIGADETFELGRGRTKPLVDSLGLGPAYLDFLARIATALHPAGRRLLFWGAVTARGDADGEALFEPNWYGVLFGAAASWQPGTADIAEFQRRFGAAFCGDVTGTVDDAERRLLAAHALLDSAGLGGATDDLF